MIEKDKFLQQVMGTLEEHPEWNTDVIQAMTAGIHKRLNREMKQRANCETALVIAYEAGKNKIPEYQINIVKDAIKTSFAFKGTEYVNEL